MKQFSEFANIHSGKRALVLGLGVSTKQIVGKDTRDLITIGVNDIGSIYTPKYLLTVDMSSRFQPQRSMAIRDTEAEYLFTHIEEWKKATRLMDKVVSFKLGARSLQNINNIGVLDFSNNSPYIAIILAYQMGCREIGLLGVDFTENHCHMQDGTHELMRANRIQEIEKDYLRLSEVLKANGCNLYNLSEISIIKSLNKMKLEQYITNEIHNTKP